MYKLLAISLTEAKYKSNQGDIPGRYDVYINILRII